MTTYCFGTDCPIKHTCSLFKEDIDVMKDFHFTRVPYDPKRKTCEFHPNNAIITKYPKTRFGDGPAAGDL